MEIEWVTLGEVEYGEAKRLQAVLAERGVQMLLASNPDSCGTGGCKPKLEVRVPSQSMELVRAFFEEERKRSMDGLEHDASLGDEVFDPERATARCPACGTEFSTQLKECPDCGLCFGG